MSGQYGNGRCEWEIWKKGELARVYEWTKWGKKEVKRGYEWAIWEREK